MTNGRFFKQALETLNNNDCKPGDIIDAYNQKVIRGGGIAHYYNTTRGLQNRYSGGCGG